MPDQQPRLADPKLEWHEGEFKVSLPVQGGIIDAKWRPTVTSVIRIREIGTEAWSPGFETPLNTCTFVGLRPDTEYEVQVTHKNASGEGSPTSLRCTTGPSGQQCHSVPEALDRRAASHNLSPAPAHSRSRLCSPAPL